MFFIHACFSVFISQSPPRVLLKLYMLYTLIAFVTYLVTIAIALMLGTAEATRKAITFHRLDNLAHRTSDMWVFDPAANRNDNKYRFQRSRTATQTGQHSARRPIR